MCQAIEPLAVNALENNSVRRLFNITASPASRKTTSTGVVTSAMTPSVAMKLLEIYFFIILYR